MLKKVLAFITAAMLCAASIPVADAADISDIIVARGIDVSRWQGEVNWSKVAASGIDYVILRCGTSVGKDPMFEENYTGAKAAGLGVGCYFYTYADNVDEALEDAENTLGWIEGKQLEYPVYFDIESNSSTLNATDVATKMCVTYMDRLAEENWYCGVYANEDWLRSYLDRDLLLEKYDIWYARWPSGKKPATDYSDICGMWQYSDEGSVSGIYGDVDMDVSFRDYPSIMKEGGFNGFELPDPDPDPDPNPDPDPESLLRLNEECGLVRSENFILGALPGMTVGALRECFEGEVTILTDDGSEPDADMPVVTGLTVSAYDGFREEVCAVVIAGDVTGDGKIGTADFLIIRDAYLGRSEIEGAQSAAADVTGDGKTGTADFLSVRDHYLGKHDLFAAEE